LTYSALYSMYTAPVGAKSERMQVAPRMTPCFPPNSNSCATRLSDALTRVDPGFFVGHPIASIHQFQANQSSGKYVPDGGEVGFRYVPVERSRTLNANAAGLAQTLRRKFGGGQVVTKAAKPKSSGIIFFSAAPGGGVSGHITLWTGERSVDGGEYWDWPKIEFWALP